MEELEQIISKIVTGKIKFFHRTVRGGTNSSAHLNIPKSNIGKKAIIAVIE